METGHFRRYIAPLFSERKRVTEYSGVEARTIVVGVLIVKNISEDTLLDPLVSPAPLFRCERKVSGYISSESIMHGYDNIYSATA